MALITTKFIADNAVTDSKIRLLNAGWLRARNAANSADINILEVDGSDVIQFGSVPQVPAMAVSNSDVSNKQYVDQVVTNLIDKMTTEFFSLSSGDISNGYIDLANPAFDDSVEVTAGGVTQILGLDYSLSLPTANTRVTFLSPLTSILAAGDNVTVNYNISTSIVSGGPVFVNLLKEVAVINDSKATGVDGGTFSNGSWLTRDLNTIQATQPWLSLSSNQFSLEAGTYDVNFSAPGFSCSGHKAKLYNVTDSVDAIIGSSAYSIADSEATQTDSIGSGTITISSQKTFEIRHISDTTKTINGFGVGGNFVVSEVFTQVEITKLSPVAKDFFIGPVCTTSSLITTSTFSTYPNSPTLIFTPTVSGAYRVYCDFSAYMDTTGSYGSSRIFNTSGNATLLAENSNTADNPAGTIVAAIPAESIYNLVAGNSYSFDIQGRVTSGNNYSRGDLGQFQIFAEKLGAVMGGALTAPQTFFQSAACTTQGNVTTTVAQSFPNSPTLTFTPDLSGTYKVYCSFPFQSATPTDVNVCLIRNTAGSATLLAENQQNNYDGSGTNLITPAFVQSVFTLTSGVSYSFDLQAKNTSGSTLYARGDFAQFYIFAEKVG